MSYLYDTDILLWSPQQADLLRRHAVGDRAAGPVSVLARRVAG
jgi:hypothetical protein